ncbi:subtilisin-like protease SBT1.2 [Tanacetum coccineum]|uniref:Subtilisin-like protease SBT1.2 n=1 Tax=Tanacetum coccineum TaxID=301880 RepID=A0ABQ4X3Q4_9ASTR
MNNHEQPTPSHPKSDVRNTTGKNKQTPQGSARTTSVVDLGEFCKKHYEKLLPIMADKYEYEQRKKETPQFVPIPVAKASVAYIGCKTGKWELLFELVSFKEKIVSEIQQLYKDKDSQPRFGCVLAESLMSIVARGNSDLYIYEWDFAAQIVGLRKQRRFENYDQCSICLWKDSNYAKGTIIGVLDTGITPGHLSFHDKGMPPPPSRWNGKCEVVACNNKLIGIRNFVRGSSAVDQQGHGTHTSSTAAGNFVDSCPESKIIAGMDAAIEDGVDVISLSLGGQSAPFYQDPIAIGTFAAIQKGIFVTCSAGNSGPSKSTLSNEAPWILTVGASTMDRKIRTTVYLGNNKLLDGESLYQPKNFHQKLMPLVYPGRKGDHSAAQWMVVKDARGAAMILANTKTVCPEATEPEPHVLPASNIGYKEGVEIKKYLVCMGVNAPPVIATILHRGTILGVKSAPEVACFSSRGPNLASPGILNPGHTLDQVLTSLQLGHKLKVMLILLHLEESIGHVLTLAGISGPLLSNAPPGTWSPAA